MNFSLPGYDFIVDHVSLLMLLLLLLFVNPVDLMNINVDCIDIN